MKKILFWIFSLLALVFCIHIFLFVDQHSHSISDTLYGIFPYWAPTIIIWWLCYNRYMRMNEDAFMQREKSLKRIREIEKRLAELAGKENEGNAKEISDLTAELAKLENPPN